MWVGGFGFGGEGWRWKTPVWQSCLFVDLQPLCPDARWYTRTILGPDVRQRLLMGAVCPWGACGGQGSSCAKPHSLTNSVQVRRKRTGANILRAPPRRSAKLQQCGPTFETILHGGHAVRGVYAPVTLDAISHAGSGVGAVRPGRLSIAWVVGEGRAGALVRGDGVLRLSRERCAALLWDGLER